MNLLVFLTPHVIESGDDMRRLMERKTEERRRMVEALYGTRDAPPVTIDFARKPGPLAALGRRVERLERPPGDRHIEPAVN